MADYVEVVALAARFDDQERPWIATCMSKTTSDMLTQEEFDEWKRKALDLVLYDTHEVREVVLRVPQERLDALFAVDAIEAEVADA